MPRTRPAVISLSDLEQAAKNAAVLALDERQLTSVSGGALISTIDPTTMGMFPTEPVDPTFTFSALQGA